MNCPQCGAENMRGAEKCWQCGTRLNAEPEPRSRNSVIVWSVMAAVALAAILMLFLATSGGGGGGGAPSSIDSTASAVATSTAPAVK
ncbi:MAG: hypothetical protein WCJ13_03880 [Coriobacteriia bacterium]